MENMNMEGPGTGGPSSGKADEMPLPMGETPASPAPQGGEMPMDGQMDMGGQN